MADKDTRFVSHRVDVAANTAEDFWFMPPASSGEWFLDSAYFVPRDDIAIHGTDYVKEELFNGATSLGSITTYTGGTAYAQGVPVPFTLSGGKSREFTGGTDTIKYAHTEGGTGPATNGDVYLGWRQLS
jgi:hypothetical protein